MNSPAGILNKQNALLHLTKWLAVNMAPNVNVNMISPGGLKEINQNLLLKNIIIKCH